MTKDAVLLQIRMAPRLFGCFKPEEYDRLEKKISEIYDEICNNFEYENVDWSNAAYQKVIIIFKHKKRDYRKCYTLHMDKGMLRTSVTLVFNFKE